MATTTLMLMTTPTIGRVVQSNQLTIMLVVVHCVEEAVREKKRKRTVKINWLRVRRLGGYKKKNVFKGVHVYGGYTFTVYTVVTEVVVIRTANSRPLPLPHTGVQYDVEHSHVRVVLYMLRTT